MKFSQVAQFLNWNKIYQNEPILKISLPQFLDIAWFLQTVALKGHFRYFFCFDRYRISVFFSKRNRREVVTWKKKKQLLGRISVKIKSWSNVIGVVAYGTKNLNAATKTHRSSTTEAMEWNFVSEFIVISMLTEKCKGWDVSLSGTVHSTVKNYIHCKTASRTGQILSEIQKNSHLR